MRPIDADKLIKDIDYSADLGGALGKVVEVVKTYAKFMVQTAPTIEQPEIIHCKDCKWKDGSECVRFAEIRPFPNDFCSRAEREESKDENA